MYALIDKQTNAILKVGTEYVALSDVKPFHWVECPDETTSLWYYDGVSFTAPVIPVVPESVVHNNNILSQIEDIENTITPRRLREAVLTEEGANWLASKEAEISALRQQLI